MADGSVTIDVTLSKEQLEKALGSLKNDLNSLGSSTKGFGDKIASGLETIGTAAEKAGAKLTLGLTTPIAALLTTGVKYNAQLESYETALKTLTGSADEARKIMNQIQKDAASTPFDVAGLTQANQLLVSTGLSAKESREVILALGDAVSATGGGNAELSRMAVNLQQIKNTGKATALDIKQFAYAGIDIYGLLADYTGKTKQEVTEMEVTWDLLNGALIKASKQGGKYFGAMQEQSKTTKGAVSNLKDSFSRFTGSLSKSLVPTINEIIKDMTKWLDKFDKLSPSTKKSITTILLLTAAIGPMLTAFGKITKVTSSVINGVSTFTKAISLAKNGIGDATGSAANLAKGFQGIISPAGAATLGVAAFATAVMLVKSHVDKEYQGLTKLNEELKNNNEARKSAIQGIEEQRNASLGEINYVENLRKELSLLVDENGKVNDGYELRAKFILGELNNALGTEYSMTGDVINNYKELGNTIDDLIQKKKAQIILEANEAAFKEAIQQKDSAYKDYIKTQEALEKATERYNQLQEESKKGFVGSKQSLVENSLEMNKLSKEISDLSSNLSNEKETLEKYSTEIEKYQKNSELMLKGGTENYKKIEESVSTTQNNITKLANAGLNERLQAQIKANEQSKKEYALEAQYNEDAKNSIYATNVKKGQENLSLLTDELISRTSTVKTLGEDEKNAWKTLANNSYDEYDKALSKMPQSMKNKIVAMTGVASSDTTVQQATKGLAEDANSGFNNNVNGSKWGSDLVSLIAGGMTSSRSKNKISWASSLVAGWISSFLHFSVPEEGPLSDMDKSMPDMIDLMVKGLDLSKHKLTNKMQLLSQDLKDSMDLTNKNFKLFDSDLLLKRLESAVTSETQRLSTSISTTANVGRVLSANIQLNQGNIIMDGEKVGQVITPVVTRTLRGAGAY